MNPQQKNRSIWPVAYCVREEIMDRWTTAKNEIAQSGKKVLYYMSAEFLIGRGMVNNMINLGVFDKYQEALQSVGIDIMILKKKKMTQHWEMGAWVVWQLVF